MIVASTVSFYFRKTMKHYKSAEALETVVSRRAIRKSRKQSIVFSLERFKKHLNSAKSYSSFDRKITSLPKVVY